MSEFRLSVGLVTPEQRAAWYWLISDSVVLIQRSVRQTLRNLEAVLVAMVVPVNVLLLFRFVFGGAINTGEVDYVNYVVAGAIVQGLAWSTTSTAVNVCNDMHSGLIIRFRSLPMLISAVLTGHVAASIVRCLLSTVMVILVGLLIGFRPAAGAVEWIAILGIVILFSLAISWVAALFGLLANTPDGATGLTFILIFLPYLSSAFVPTGHMPTVLRVIAQNQPVTHVTETIRALTLGMPVGAHGGWAVVWCVSILTASYFVADRLFKRQTSD